MEQTTFKGLYPPPEKEDNLPTVEEWKEYSSIMQAELLFAERIEHWAKYFKGTIFYTPKPFKK